MKELTDINVTFCSMMWSVNWLLSSVMGAYDTPSFIHANWKVHKCLRVPLSLPNTHCKRKKHLPSPIYHFYLKVYHGHINPHPRMRGPCGPRKTLSGAFDYYRNPQNSKYAWPITKIQHVLVLRGPKGPQKTVLGLKKWRASFGSDRINNCATSFEKHKHEY